MSVSFDPKYIKFSTGSGGSSYCTEYQAVYNAMTNKPTSAIADAQNTLVEKFKTDNVWSKFTAVYLFAQYSNSAGEALINWKNPGTLNASAVNSPTFTSLEGFTGNGSSSYINSTVSLSTEGDNYTQNSGSIGVYCRTGGTQGDRYLFGLSDLANSQTLLMPYEGSSKFYFDVNGQDERGVTNSAATQVGMWVVNRSASNAMQCYRNGNNVSSQSTTGHPLHTIELYFLAFNSNGTATGYLNAQISFAFISSSLTSTDVSNINTAIETYMDSNSKGIQ